MDNGRIVTHLLTYASCHPVSGLLRSMQRLWTPAPIKMSLVKIGNLTFFESLLFLSRSSSGDRRVPWLRKSSMVWIWQCYKRTDDCKIILNLCKKIQEKKFF